jgi:hypothetical protein
MGRRTNASLSVDFNSSNQPLEPTLFSNRLVLNRTILFPRSCSDQRNEVLNRLEHPISNGLYCSFLFPFKHLKSNIYNNKKKHF